jgi:hypothetical protein
MDEVDFENLSPVTKTMCTPWRPGLWAHMMSLAQLFGPIQDLNRKIAENTISLSESIRVASILAERFDLWESMLPTDVQLTHENLQRHAERHTGGPFVGLHLGHHHYATLLYYRFLELPDSVDVLIRPYSKRCKFHASSYSRLLSLARQTEGCEVFYPTVGHMAVVSSSVLLHSLIADTEGYMQLVRKQLEANFEAIVELQQYWPNTATMV